MNITSDTPCTFLNLIQINPVPCEYLTKVEFPYQRIRLFVLVKLQKLLHSTAVSIVLPAANGWFVFKRFCVKAGKIDNYTT